MSPRRTAPQAGGEQAVGKGKMPAWGRKRRSAASVEYPAGNERGEDGRQGDTHPGLAATAALREP